MVVFLKPCCAVLCTELTARSLTVYREDKEATKPLAFKD